MTKQLHTVSIVCLADFLRKSRRFQGERAVWMRTTRIEVSRTEQSVPVREIILAVGDCGQHLIDHQLRLRSESSNKQRRV